MCYISKKRSAITLNGRTSAWVNQKGYTTFPYIYHDWKTKYVIYPSVTLNVKTSAWVNPKGKTTFPILTVNEKLSMLYILEGLYTQYQDKQHLPAILIYEIWQIITKKYIYISWYISQKWSGITKQKNITGLNFKKMDIFKIKQRWLCHTIMGAHNLKIQMLYC